MAEGHFISLRSGPHERAGGGAVVSVQAVGRI
jgi:hypothetical protein